jgi:outer membrane protein assembly factor BamA
MQSLQTQTAIWGLWIFLLILPLAGFSQARIQSFQFRGIEKHDSSYLARFMELEPGETFDLAQINNDAQQLINLPSISDVKVQIDTINSEFINVVFELDESLTLFPIIGFGGIQGNFWFQLGFNELNLAGRGMQLSAFYRLNDNRHNFNLFYRVPFIRGSRWGASISALRFASIEPLYFDDIVVPYRYTNYSISPSVTYQLGLRHELELGFSAFQENYRKNIDEQLGSSPGPDSLSIPKGLLKFNYRNNKLNYHFHQVWGWDVFASVQSVYNPKDDVFFHILISELRYFQRFGKRGNLGLRWRAGISTNEESPFAPFVLDSHVNIRGSGNRVDRGTAVLLWNTEYRHDIYNRKDFATQLVAFSDLGTWRSPGGNLGELAEVESLRHFVGGGVRVLYKRAFDAVIRVDYGVDIFDSQQRGFVIGFGQYF